MFENPGDELYFGEVYRTVLQEAWLPEGAEVWQRAGKSRRGRRPTQQGLYPHSPTQDQAIIRQCFSKCAAAWNALPWDNPVDTSCDNRWGKEYWKKQKDDRGLMCSYYDVYMRFCLRRCLDTQCIPPANYLLSVEPQLTDIECNKVYDLIFSNACGPVHLVSGAGEFVAPSEWVSPSCGSLGILCFEDQNQSLGSTTFQFSPEHTCVEFIWPGDNPTHITPNTSESIHVQGGVSPFFWSVSGHGFSLASPTTTDPSNTLIAANDACGRADIHVIDICGNELTAYILSTLGQWILKSTGVCELPGVGTQIGEAGAGDGCSYRYFFELIDTYKRQLQTRCRSGQCSFPSPPDLCDNYCISHNKSTCGDPPPSNCIDPDPSFYPWEKVDPDHWSCWCVKGLAYYEWEC